MSTEEPCTENKNRKKRKMRNIITPIDGLQIDESDYRVVNQIFQDCLRETQSIAKDSEGNNTSDELNGENEVNQESKLLDIRTIFDVRKDDCDRRVQNLSILMSTKPLPKSLLLLDALETLRIVPTRFEIPKWLGDLKTLKKLTVFLEEGQALPQEISHLASLQVLDVIGERNSSFVNSSRSIGNLKNLKEISISLEEVPREIGDFTNLKILRFDTSIRSIPTSIGDLKSLQTLSFQDCDDLYEIPEEIGELRSLQVLQFWSSGIRSLPRSVGNLTNLRVMDLEDARDLSKLPEEIGNLRNLECMNLKGCSGLESLPSSLANLENLKVLNLSELDALSSLPDRIGYLKKLVRLDLSYSGIAAFPYSLGNLKSLTELNLNGCTDISLTLLPDLIRRLPNLKISHNSFCDSFDKLRLDNKKNYLPHRVQTNIVEQRSPQLGR